MTDQSVTRREEEPLLVQHLNNMKGELERALPRHMRADRLARITLTELRKTPALANVSPQSFFGALLTAAALGLEPGVNGECYLVPYKGNCELVIGYQGVAKLFWQHPMAKRLTAEYVCANDHFKYDKGLNPRLEHTPATGDRGPVIGYYAIAELTNGAVQFDYFTAEQIKAIRGGKVGSKGDIADPERWMERKTAIKQILKLMPKSPEVVQAMAVDETIGSMSVGKSIAAGGGVPPVEHVDDTQDAEVVDEQGVLDA